MWFCMCLMLDKFLFSRRIDVLVSPLREMCSNLRWRGWGGGPNGGGVSVLVECCRMRCSWVLDIEVGRVL
jgi:hypothetical protein